MRALLMKSNDEGLTKTYNRFHDPGERFQGILDLRELHAVLDRVVLDAYGWTDIRPMYDFRPQLDESIRYTWSDDVRDEVLARLLELNRKYAEEEKAQEQAAAPATGKRKGGGRKKKDEATLTLAIGGADTTRKDD